MNEMTEQDYAEMAAACTRMGRRDEMESKRKEIVRDVVKLEMSAVDLLDVVFRHIPEAQVRRLHQEVTQECQREMKRRGQ